MDNSAEGKKTDDSKVARRAPSPSAPTTSSRPTTPGLTKLVPSKRTYEPSGKPRATKSQFRPIRPFHGISNLSDYEVIEKLGEGTFGEVSKAKQLKTGRLVALKRLLVHNAKEGFPITALREIVILKQLKNRNVLTLLDMCVKEQDKTKRKVDFFMVTPYMSYDLTGLLENPKVKLQVSHIKCFMIQLLNGIQFIHEQHFFHRDIKAANILIDFNGVLKIADFGLARKYHGKIPQLGKGPGGGERPYTGLVVTRWYRPPELLLGERKYTTSVDMWGIGCVFGEMFTHKPILAGKSDVHQSELIFRLLGSPNKESWPGFNELPNHGMIMGPFRRTLEEKFGHLGEEGVKLLGGLLNLDPRRRWNALDALDHPYFNVAPLPVQPHELPKFEESHEIDLKRYKEEREKEKLERSSKEPLPPPPFNGNTEKPHFFNERHSSEFRESRYQSHNRGDYYSDNYVNPNSRVTYHKYQKDSYDGRNRRNYQNDRLDDLNYDERDFRGQEIGPAGNRNHKGSNPDHTDDYYSRYHNQNYRNNHYYPNPKASRNYDEYSQSKQSNIHNLPSGPKNSRESNLDSQHRKTDGRAEEVVQSKNKESPKRGYGFNADYLDRESKQRPSKPTSNIFKNKDSTDIAKKLRFLSEPDSSVQGKVLAKTTPLKNESHDTNEDAASIQRNEESREDVSITNDKRESSHEQPRIAEPLSTEFSNESFPKKQKLNNVPQSTSNRSKYNILNRPPRSIPAKPTPKPATNRIEMLMENTRPVPPSAVRNGFNSLNGASNDGAKDRAKECNRK